MTRCFQIFYKVVMRRQVEIYTQYCVTKEAGWTSRIEKQIHSFLTKLIITNKLPVKTVGSILNIYPLFTASYMQFLSV